MDKIKVITIYEYDNVEEWTGNPKEDFESERERGYLTSEEIDGITTEDNFPQNNEGVFFSSISGKIVSFSENWVEYEIERICRVNEKGREAVEKWNKKCSESKVEEVA